MIFGALSWMPTFEYYLKTSAGITNDYNFGAKVVYKGQNDPLKKGFQGTTVWVPLSGKLYVDVENSAYPDPDGDGRSDDRWVLVSLKVFMVSGFTLKLKYYDQDAGGIVYAKYAFSSDSSPSDTFTSYSYNDFRTVTFVLEHPVFAELVDGADICVETDNPNLVAISEIYVTRLIGYYPQRGIGNVNLKTEVPKFGPTDKILIVSNFFAAWWNFRKCPWNFSAAAPFYDWWGVHPWDWDPDNPKSSMYCPYDVEWWKRELLDLKDAGVDVFLPNFCGMSSDSFFAQCLDKMVKAYYELKGEGWKTDVLPYQDSKALPRPAQFLETYFVGEWVTANRERLDFSTYYGRVFLLLQLRRFWFQIPAEFWGLFQQGSRVIFPMFFYGDFSITGNLNAADLEWVAQKFAEEIASLNLGVSSSDVIVYIHLPWGAFWSSVGGGNFYSNYASNLLCEKWAWGLGQISPPDLGKYTLTVGPGYDDSHQPIRSGKVRDRAWGEWYRIGYDVSDGSEKGMWNTVLRNLFHDSGYNGGATSFNGQKCKITIVTWNENAEGSNIEDTLEWGRLFIEDTSAYNALFKKGYYKFTDDSDFDISTELGAVFQWYKPSSLGGLTIPSDGWAILKVKLRNQGSSCWLTYSKRGKGHVALRVDGPTQEFGRFYIPGNMGPYDSRYNPRGEAIIPVIVSPKFQGGGSYSVFVRVSGVGRTSDDLAFNVIAGDPSPASVSGLSARREPGKINLSWDAASGGDNPVRGYRVYAQADLASWAFKDSFDNGKELGWDELFGKWWVEDGIYKVRVRGAWSYAREVTPGVGDYGVLGSYFGGSDWSDYVMEVKFNVRLISEDWRDGMWIGFRWKDPGNHYVFALVRGNGYGEEKIHVYKIKDWQVVWDENNTPVNVTYQLHRYPDYYYWVPLYQGWHRLKIVAKGNHFEFYIDDEKVGEFEDSDPISSGGIVLGARRYFASGGYTEVWYDDFSIVLTEAPLWVYMGYTEQTEFSFDAFDNIGYKVKVVPLDYAMVEGGSASVQVSAFCADWRVISFSAEDSGVLVRRGGILRIDLGAREGEVEIYSLSGVKVYSAGKGAGDRVLSIPVRFPVGAYVMRMKSGGKVLYRRLVVR